MDNEVTNTEGILESIKKMLGLLKEYTAFDSDIIIHINSVFTILNQLGVGPKEGFKITGYEEQWSDFTNDKLNIENVKTYVYLKVRLLFDPPLNSSVLDSTKQLIGEYEFRLNITEKEESDNE